MKDLFPSAEKVDSFRGSLMDLSSKFRDSLENLDIGKQDFNFLNHSFFISCTSYICWQSVQILDLKYLVSAKSMN